MNLVMQKLAYQRVLLKISGEILMGARGVGIDFAVCRRLAALLSGARALGVQIAVVIGGGNLCRGATMTDLPRVLGDQMGMLATLMNGIALGHALTSEGVAHRVLSAISTPFLESYSWDIVQSSFDRGELLLFVGGTAHPYFTTDSAAALRALEMGAELLIKGTKVDGIYDKDPLIYPDAKKFERVSYADVLAQRLKVMDPTAIALCQEQSLPIQVVDLFAADVLRKVLTRQPIGTWVGDVQGL